MYRIENKLTPEAVEQMKPSFIISFNYRRVLNLPAEAEMLLDDLRPQGHGGDGAHGAHGMVREAHGEAEALLHVLYGGQVHLLRIRHTLTIDCSNRYFQVGNGTWQGENLYQLYGKGYMPWEWQPELKEKAETPSIFIPVPFLHFSAHPKGESSSAKYASDNSPGHFRSETVFYSS